MDTIEKTLMTPIQSSAEESFEDLDTPLLQEMADARAREIFSQVSTRFNSELYPLLAEIKRRLPHGQWQRWFAAWRRRVGFAFGLRTVQRRLKQLEREINTEEQQDQFGESETTQQDARDSQQASSAQKAPPALLRKRIRQVIETLSSPSIMSDDMRVGRALELLEDTECALADGLLERAAVPTESAGLPIFMLTDKIHRVVLRAHDEPTARKLAAVHGTKDDAKITLLSSPVLAVLEVISVNDETVYLMFD